VKKAYREGQIDIATAEAFAAVPDAKQVEVWNEIGGNPQHAQHVRNIIANDWIEATHAIFDVSTLPAWTVSQDLFADQTLIERKAFLAAQAEALQKTKESLADDGWREVVTGRWEDVQDRLLSMSMPEREFDAATAKRLTRIADRKHELEKKVEALDPQDQAAIHRLQNRFDTLDAAEREVVQRAPEFFTEETKAMATAFLILDPDGRVHREIRVARRTTHPRIDGNGHVGDVGAPVTEEPPTSDDLCDRQLSATFTHQALAVREAVLQDDDARMRLLALILHDKVRSEALAIHHEANGTTVHASTGETFKSEAFDRLSQKRAKLDPFVNQHHVEDVQGYEALAKLTDGKLRGLIDLLVVECLTAQMIRRTPLVEHLAKQLKVNIRDHWRPDAEWLSGFQKIQLAHLVTELKGSLHAPGPERKKSELVELLVKLFTDAAEGTVEDKEVAARVNAWLPSNLRDAEGGKGK
jgi:hypothetical protein